MGLSDRTELNGRILWNDGSSSYDPSSLLTALAGGRVEHVTELTDEVRALNRLLPSGNELTVKSSCNPISTKWTTPSPYSTLDVEQYLVSAHEILFLGVVPDEEFALRERRLCQEILAYKDRGLFDVVRAVIWIINTLTANSVVWGVGRGSSVSSYVLYVIGVHDVDSYLYDLSLDDFLHN